MSDPSWLPQMLKAPQTVEDLDERSAKNRLRVAQNIEQFLGVSIKDQCEFYNQVTGVRSSFMTSVRAQRDQCHQNISLANRYRLTLGLSVLAFCMFRRHAMRRTVMTFSGLTWFLCPEWASAYFYPRKPLTDLLPTEDEISKAALARAEEEKNSSKPSLDSADPNSTAQYVD